MPAQRGQAAQTSFRFEFLRPGACCRHEQPAVRALEPAVALGGFDDAKMGAMWRLQNGGQDVMAMPRVAFVRAIMLNHWYHHRGQLLVYLRLLNLPVPSVYGPRIRSWLPWVCDGARRA